jgi:phage tail protein X
MLLTHVTTEGERWDQLAWRYYGDAHRYQPIVDANPHVPISAALPAGLTLAIPLLEPVAATEDLPPWMR